jgi:hypothetical protein
MRIISLGVEEAMAVSFIYLQLNDRMNEEGANSQSASTILRHCSRYRGIRQTGPQWHVVLPYPEHV